MNMAAAISTPSAPRRLLTVDDLYRMVEAGILGEKERVELIDGEMYRMTPIGPRHWSALLALDQLLRVQLAGKHVVSVQGPLRVDDENYFEPDLIILRPDATCEPYGIPTPVDVAFIVEVADSSLALDRDTKAPKYARYGIPEYWILDAVSQTVLVHRDPRPSGYASCDTRSAGQRISPLLIPEFVADPGELFRPGTPAQ